MEELKKELYNLETIKANRTFSEQLQERKVSLKPTKKHEKREITTTPLEKAVMSRRPYLEPSDNEEDFSEQDGKL